MFAVTVTFQVDPSQITPFKAAMRINAQSTLTQEEGCRQFDVCTTPERPSEVFLYEIYDNEAAFKSHMTTSHFEAFGQATKGMVISKDVKLFSEVQR
ncbi:putative quinol monooxygenase [uncultured Litoreibacter sp.]|uniref:putative quinol monooxygenase n=1 Tax=uncultured Litoreibacter sp. TaxID=1392394 RepID=UPI002635D0A9|nr:putative quinol monooxygenase [uncultured Litoreibacter sp.]